MRSLKQKSDSWWDLSLWDKINDLCLRPIFAIPMIAILGCGVPMVLIACEDPVALKQSRQNSHATNLAEDLEYFRDDKTGICFAGMYIGGNATAVTYVPCKDVKEENLIHFNSRDKR